MTSRQKTPWRKTVPWVKEYVWFILGVLFLIGVSIALVFHYTWQYGPEWATRLLPLF